MTALTAARNTRVMGRVSGRLGASTGLIVKAAEVLWQGALLQMDENGEVVAGSLGLSKNRIPLGRCPATIDNTLDGERTAVDEGSFHWTLSGADENDVGLSAYAVDDQTVSKARHGSGTAQVNTETPTAVIDTHYAVQVRWDEHGEGDWKSTTLAHLSDGSTDATEICDALRVHLAATDALTGIITGTGTDTLILTGAQGVRFEISNVGTGVVADAASTPGVYVDHPYVGKIVGYDGTGVFVHTAR